MKAQAQKRWPASLLVVFLAPVALATCTGKVSSTSGGSPAAGQTSSGGNGPPSSGSGSGGKPISGGTGSGGTTVGGGSGGSGGASPMMTSTPPVPIDTNPSSTSPAESAGTLLTRRLTYSEYDHVLADLLGDQTAPAEDVGHPWGADGQNTDGFTTPDNAPDQLIRDLNDAADTVVDAANAAGKIPLPAGCTAPTAAQEASCVTQFITSFGLKAFRRPVSAAEQTDMMALFTAVRGTAGLGLSFKDSIAAIVKGMIQSASFLYHWEIGPTKPVIGKDGLVPLTQWQIASRLAENLWNSTPDDTLLSAAQANQLSTAAQVAAQAKRMIADPKAVNALNDFHQQWLLSVGSRVPNLDGVIPYGPLTQAAVDYLSTEFSSFVSSIYSTGDGTLNSFLTAPYAYVNTDLAAVYGVPAPAGGSGKVMLDPTKRGGIFTQVGFLASFGAGSDDNPVLRGLSIYNKLMCAPPMPPPIVPPGLPMIAGATVRKTYEVHGNGPCAVMCHGLFDPPGFAFENYDGVGSYRTMDNNQPVDATGTFATPGGATMTFTNAIDFMKQLAVSPEVQTCVDRQWARYILGRMETSAEAGSLTLAYRQGAMANGYSLRDMLTSFVSSKAFLYRMPSAGEAL